MTTTFAHRYAAALSACVCLASPAAADYDKIDSEAEFRSIVTGKTLTRPLVELEVTPAGDIRGTGAAWEVTGNWTWKNGYFCRDLFWGGEALGYNCQAVHVNGERVRFTSDQGRGDSADFRIRTD